MKIDLFTTHCPKCLALEHKLKEKNLLYKVHTDVDEMIKLGYDSVPVLRIDEKDYSFGDAIKWINSLEE